MKLGRGKKKIDRPRRRPRVAGRPRSSADDDFAESYEPPTVHEEVADPLIEKMSLLEQRATAWAVFWMAYFVVCQIVSDDRRFEVLVPLSLVAFYGIPACLYAAWLWKSRRRSAEKTGLREAMATVRSGWLFPRIDVYLEGGYKLLQTRRSLRIAPRFKGLEKVPVFIGGEETDMIVIFPRGRFSKDTLYTVPVKEIEPDTD